MKRFDDDDDDDDDDSNDDDSNETGNPYRLDSDETGGIKKNAFNAKFFLQTDSECPIFFLVGWETLGRCYYKEFI